MVTSSFALSLSAPKRPDQTFDPASLDQRCAFIPAGVHQRFNAAVGKRADPDQNRQSQTQNEIDLDAK